MTGNPKNQDASGKGPSRSIEEKSLVGSAFTSQSEPFKNLSTTEEVDQGDDD
ncbi:hypothetical protein [Nesterenkonia jeotgali]|uniref:Uncharacterized protein n=1 Tax=Nesterenkonia jeotgali TaxID=317018 RepID=A0A839FZ41_9MICC|nr:hypothetical protein [Nesterenkonia jeotgali]MBA8922334.1 hypothetical protein [Nesterenkonia jeotgali]